MGKLTIKYTPSNPVPSDGHVIGYRIKGTTDAYTEYSTSEVTSPIIIENVDSTHIYDCYIQSNCGGGMFSEKAYFDIYPPVLYSREFYGIGWWSPNDNTNINITTEYRQTAFTRDKLFLSQSNQSTGDVTVEEYDVVLDPFSRTFVRNIVFNTSGTNTSTNAIFAKSNTLLSVQSSNKKVYDIDISGVTPIITELFNAGNTLPNVGNMNGNILLYNSILNRYLFSYRSSVDTDNYYLVETDAQGNLIASCLYERLTAGEVNFSDPNSLSMYSAIAGLFLLNDKVMLVNNYGGIYEVRESGLVLYKQNILGTSQRIDSIGVLQEYANISFENT